MGYFNRKDFGNRPLMALLSEAIDAGQIPRHLLRALDPVAQYMEQRGRQLTPLPLPPGAYELRAPDRLHVWLARRPDPCLFGLVRAHALLETGDDDEDFETPYGRNGPYLQAVAYGSVALRLLQKSKGDAITVLTCDAPLESDAGHAWIVDFEDDEEARA